MKRLFNYKYTKLTLLLLSTILAYYLFSNDSVVDVINHLDGLSYLGVLIAGLLFAFGFTTPFAIGFFITYSPENIILAALIGGFGAFLTDSLIFKIIKISFMDEFKSLRKNFKIRSHWHYKFFKSKTRLYITYVLVGIILASPLPDEVGVSLLSGFTKVKFWVFALLSFLMNSIGIFIMLYLASL